MKLTTKRLKQIIKEVLEEIGSGKGGMGKAENPDRNVGAGYGSPNRPVSKMKNWKATIEPYLKKLPDNDLAKELLENPRLITDEERKDLANAMKDAGVFLPLTFTINAKTFHRDQG